MDMSPAHFQRVFSQWVGSLRRLSKRLKRFGPLEYHGKIPSKQRDPIIDKFRNDPESHVLLMSYGAGSVGLNLQFASYVFLFDGSPASMNSSGPDTPS